MYFITYNYRPLNYRVRMLHRHKQQSLNAIKLATLSSSTLLPTVAGVDIFILSNHVPSLLYPLSTFDDRIKKERRRSNEKSESATVMEQCLAQIVIYGGAEKQRTYLKRVFFRLS